MNIYDALILKAVGGGGGTTVVANPEGEATDGLEKLQVGNDIYEIPQDYEDLDNKPSINDVTLSGNKTPSDLGLQPTLDGAQIVEGNPITVTDAEPMNAESVKVELEPKQDLHGYPKPWVGGASKNLLPMTVDGIKASNTTGSWSGNTYTLNGVTFEVLTDSAGNIEGIEANGLASASATFVLCPNVNIESGGYFISGCPNGGGNDTYRITVYYGSSFAFDIGSGVGVTVPSGSSIGEVNIRIGSGTNVSNLTFYPMIRLSTETDPTFEPYSNICPISGYSEVNVERVGKNWCPAYTSTETQHNVTIEGNSKGEISINGTLDGTELYGFILINSMSLEAGTYILSGANPNGAVILLYDANDNLLAYSIGNPSFTLENTTITRLRLFVYANVQYDEVVRPMIRKSTESSEFEPYAGKTYTVSLDGTKYGGVLDVTSGVLTVDRAIVDLGTKEYSYNDTALTFSSTLDAVVRYSTSEQANAISSAFNCVSNTVLTGDLTLDASFSIHYAVEYNWINIRCLQYGNDINAFRTAMNGVQLVYELATPLTIQLTPTDITLLENTNNISSDGTNIQLRYQPNNVIGETKAYTDEQVQKVLPPLPTTDGTYHLSCEVTSGVGVLSWVSDS